MLLESILQVAFSLMLLTLPAALLVSAVLLIRGVIRLVQMLLAEPGSGKRKDLKKSMARSLIAGAVVFGCTLLLGFTLGSLALANM